MFQPHLLVWRTGPGAEEDEAEGRLVFHPDLPHRGCAQENAAHWFEYVHPRRSGAHLPRKITVQLCKSPICFGGACNTVGGDQCSAPKGFVLLPRGPMDTEVPRCTEATRHHLFFFFNLPFMYISFKIYFIVFYFWLCWVFVAAHGLSLVVASGGYSSFRCMGFSLWWLLLLWSMGSRRAGFSSCGTRAQ